jgi:arylsulfatase A-like enzyme
MRPEKQTMKTTAKSVVLILLFLAASFPGLGVAADSSRPNIVIILVDDMGFSDIGCYGGEIPTPNLDTLAAGGIRFSQFYNNGRCCPTRASLLTGLHAHQAGVGGMTGDQGVPGYRGFLNDRCVTIAEVLRTAGYFTAHTGKWHVGDGDEARLPLQRGFDRFYGVPEGGGFYFRLKAGRTIRLGNETLHSIDNPLPDGWYSTDAWTDYGLRFIDEAREAEKPFFLYLAHNAPHFPLQAAPEDIEKFRGQYKNGWDQMRQHRHARQKEIGLMPADCPLTPRDAAVEAWDALTPEQQDDLDHLMSLHAAVMHRLDRSIGVLVDGLKERGALDNTLLLFLSDNGASDEGGLLGKFGGGMPGDAQSDVYYGRAWANASNTPFRLYKKNSHEGGIATPLIAHWPAGISARGQWCSQPAHVIDLMATCVDLAGATYPQEHNGKPILPMEGVSLKPLLLSPTDSLPVPRALFWEHMGHAAVRKGDMKLVRQGRDGAWELYDMTADRTEMNNLAPEFPEKVKDLEEKWEAWAERANVKPHPTRGR